MLSYRQQTHGVMAPCTAVGHQGVALRRACRCEVHAALPCMQAVGVDAPLETGMSTEGVRAAVLCFARICFQSLTKLRGKLEPLYIM